MAGATTWWDMFVGLILDRLVKTSVITIALGAILCSLPIVVSWKTMLSVF